MTCTACCGNRHMYEELCVNYFEKADERGGLAIVTLARG